MASRVKVSDSMGSRSARSRPKRLRKRSATSRTYLALIQAHRLRPIRSAEDLDQAIDVLDTLLTRPEPLDEQEQEYVEMLENEIERYEVESVPMPELSGADMLQHLIDAREETISEVARGARIAVSTLSAILNGTRQLNLDHARKLGHYFQVDPSIFV